MPIEKPPPVIGKIGYYTVFITPNPNSTSESINSSSQNPVQPPPVHYGKTAASKLGFFWDAVATLQNVHSSLDDYLAHWFGLNQSKYQWALDDYYENKALAMNDQTLHINPPKLHKIDQISNEKVDSRAKDIPTKIESV